MPETDKKPKDTIVISKRNLYLVIFLVVIAIAVAIAVPATIHLKQKRNGSKDEPGKTVVVNDQIGKDGVFFAWIAEYQYYEDEDTEDGEDEENIEHNSSIKRRKAVTNCISIDEDDDEDDEGLTTNCATPSGVLYGSEYDYQGKIITTVSEFVKVFGFKSSKYDDEFFYKHSLVSIVVSMDQCGNSIERVYLSRSNKNTGIATIEYESTCGLCAKDMSVYLIEFDNDKDELVDYIEDISDENYKKVGSRHCYTMEEKKPVIYLYPTSTTNVDVKLGAPEKLTVSYPKYTDAWRVTANPDGSLIDRATGRNLYSLYYETDYTVAHGVREEGFVIKGADSASFLEEKLAQLGLNEREAEEFIIYWLPQLEKNAYSYIYFAPTSEIAENMPLNVSPAPDTVIRINMEFKALDAPITVKEQKLPATPIRQGFTLVEWGGTIL